MHAAITEREFNQFKEWIYGVAGISFSPAKKALVSSRLARRLSHHQLNSYADYFQMIASGKHPEEAQKAVDLLTTNETYFFREPKHFDFLRDVIVPRHSAGQTLRVWSAASSYGHEAYTAAMILADAHGQRPWEIVGTDISQQVVEHSLTACFPLEHASNIPEQYLKKYCLRGVRSQQGKFLIDSQLRKRVEFLQANLTATLPDIGQFDVIFLRNVMIYFDPMTKQQVVERVCSKLKSGGYLLVGHSESLNGMKQGLQPVKPAIYRKS